MWDRRRDKKANTEILISRIASISSDRARAEMRLTAISEVRNRIVHVGDWDDYAFVCAQHASLYLVGLIKFFVWNSHQLRRRAEVMRYLSLPDEPDELQGGIKAAKLRLMEIAKRPKL